MRVEILGGDGDGVGVTRISSALSCRLLDGARVTEVANWHDVTRQQIYAWRHELKKKGLLPTTADTVFLPVDMSAANDGPLVRENVAHTPAMIEVRLNGGRSLRFDSGV